MTGSFIAYGLLGVTGVFFLYTGFMSLALPIRFANTLGLEPQGASGIIEVRAQYGGFFTAAAIPQFLAIFGMLTMSFAFIVNIVIFGGLIAGRLVALLMKGHGEPVTPMIRALFWIDAIGTIAAITGLWLVTS